MDSSFTILQRSYFCKVLTAAVFLLLLTSLLCKFRRYITCYNLLKWRATETRIIFCKLKHRSFLSRFVIFIWWSLTVCQACFNLQVSYQWFLKNLEHNGTSYDVIQPISKQKPLQNSRNTYQVIDGSRGFEMRVKSN